MSTSDFELPGSPRERRPLASSPRSGSQARADPVLAPAQLRGPTAGHSKRSFGSCALVIRHCVVRGRSGRSERYSDPRAFAMRWFLDQMVGDPGHDVVCELGPWRGEPFRVSIIHTNRASTASLRSSLHDPHVAHVGVEPSSTVAYCNCREDAPSKPRRALFGGKRSELGSPLSAAIEMTCEAYESRPVP